MPDYFKTDRSGRTAHTAARRARDLVGLCGVTAGGTQWTKQMNRLDPAEDTDCRVCRAERKRGRH